jgi:serine/threonine protein kinase
MATSHDSNDTSGCAVDLSTMSLGSRCAVLTNDPTVVDQGQDSIYFEGDKSNESKLDDLSAYRRPPMPAFDYDPSTQLRIGCYVVMRTLGEGTFAKVKCKCVKEHTAPIAVARDLRTGEYVALKIVSRLKMVFLNTVEKTKREIALMARFKHPHVVEL